MVKVEDVLEFYPAGVKEFVMDAEGKQIAQMPPVLAIQGNSLPAIVQAVADDGTVTVSITDMNGRGHFRSGVSVLGAKPEVSPESCYCVQPAEAVVL